MRVIETLRVVWWHARWLLVFIAMPQVHHELHVFEEDFGTQGTLSHQILEVRMKVTCTVISEVLKSEKIIQVPSKCSVHKHKALSW